MLLNAVFLPAKENHHNSHKKHDNKRLFTIYLDVKPLFLSHGYIPKQLHRCWVLLSLLLVLIHSPVQAALWEKRYPVKIYKNQQILCDPYQVKPGDWLHKIFLRRGELAEYDFKTFSRIFKQFNPQVTHINRINSGDWILIPLKRLDEKVDTAALSGNKAIPFSSMKDRPVSTHTVAAGDRISELLMKRCGPLNSSAYKTCLALFQQLNPHVSDFNRIYPGQTLTLPGVVKKTGLGKPAHLKKRRQRILKTDAKTLFPAKLNSELLLQANRLARLLRAGFKGRGKYYFPQANGGVTLVDLEKSPLIQLNNRDRFLILPPNLPTHINKNAVLNHWPTATMVPLEKSTPTFFNLLDQFAAALNPARYPKTLDLTAFGGELTISAQWLIAPHKSNHAKLLLVPDKSITAPEMLNAMSALCQKVGVSIKEVTPDGAFTQTKRSTTPTPLLNPIEIPTKTLKARLQQIAMQLGVPYREKVSVTFPYGGVLVETMADALESPSGRLCLVDRGQFAGQGIAAIKASGLAAISLKPTDNLYERLPELLTQLSIPYSLNPMIKVLGTSHMDIRLQLEGLAVKEAPGETPLLVLAKHPDRQLIPFLMAISKKVLILGQNE